MKWIPVNSSREGIHEYHLVEDDQLAMILKFNPEIQSVRISSAVTKRLFFLENNGILTGKYQLKNEYGMLIGLLHTDKWSAGGGIINIDEKKYAYKISRSAETIFNIYDEHHDLLLTCGLSAHKDNISSEESLLNAASCSLLLGLCWLLAASVKPTFIAA